MSLCGTNPIYLITWCLRSTIQVLNREPSLLMDQVIPGGIGKTYLYSTLLSEVRSQRHIALATASSDISPSNRWNSF